MLTKEDLREALPKHLKSAATDELANKMNLLASDPEEAKIFRDSLISYSSVLQEGRFKVEDYIHAVIYVSHKLMGSTNQAAYKKTFPQRYQDLVAKGATEQVISSYVAAYNKGKLVNLVLEQSIIPTYVLNADIFQKAINTQFELMTDTNVSPKVRTEAANSLLTHLKRPEPKKVELDLGVRDNSGMNELRDMMTALAQQQRELIASGVSTRDIAHQPLPQLVQDGLGQMIDVTPETDTED